MLKKLSSANLTFAHRPKLLQMLKSKMNFPERLQQIMEQKGVKPTELSERTGIALSHISQLRHGQRSPSRKTLERLSLGLGITIDELLSGSTKQSALPKEYSSEFDKEMLLFREEVKKYGVESIRIAREMLPILFGKKKKKG